MDAPAVIDLLQVGGKLNHSDPLRHAQLLHFPADGELLVTGDLHNHRRNFERIAAFADLEHFPRRHVILQEIIHGGKLGAAGEDASLALLLEAIRWARTYPGRVHFLLANHDLAQISGTSTLKEDGDQVERFARAFTVQFGPAAGVVSAAFEAFVRSMPLAGISVTGLFMSHSLPAPGDLPAFDTGLLQRELNERDLQRGGAAYRMVWGRGQTAELLAALSRHWFAELYICGHQPQERGYSLVCSNLLILDSSHNHGVILPLALDRQYRMSELLERLVPLAAIA